MGGSLVTGRARPGQIVPVDSEHSALAQCLRAGSRSEVRRLVLTASGGPFRGRTREDLADVTRRGGAAAPHLVDGSGHHHQLRDPGQQGTRGHRGAPALRHPLRPDRGRRPPHQRRPLDGRVRRRLDAPPGQSADDDDPHRARPRLARPGPRRRARVRLEHRRDLEFFPLDDEAFPAVSLARAAGERGGTAPAVYNAANEVCVEAFRAGRLRFVDIIPTVARRRGRPRRTLGAAPHRGRRPRRRRLGARARGRHHPAPAATPARPPDDPGMTALLYILGVVAFVVAILVSIGLHEFGHLVPAKKFGVQGPAVVHRLRPHRVEQADRRDRVRHQGDPARRLRQDRRHAAPGRAGPRRGDDVRRGRRAGAQGASLQHRDVHPADLRRPRGGVGVRQAARHRPALLPPRVVEEGDRDGRRPDGQHRHRHLALRDPVRHLRQPARPGRRADRAVGPACVIPVEEARTPAPRPTRPTPAAQAGIEPGDQIVSFNGTPFSDWDSFQEQIRDNADGDAVIESAATASC